MGNFIKNPMFAAFNLVYLIRAKREVGDKVWADVISLFHKKSIKGPSPLHVHRISKVEEALRMMQTGKHMGKLVAVAGPNEIVQAIPKDTSKGLLRSDASYLLVGGLGGIGRATALWMIDHGAKNLIFANRSGLSSQEAKDTVKALESKGAATAVYRCDVSKPEAVAELIAESSKRMPPIRSYHSSGNGAPEYDPRRLHRRNPAQGSRHVEPTQPVAKGHGFLHHARVRDALKAARTLDEAADVICTALVDRISSRSNLAVENISREKPMTDYGIDSLVAVEMRNWIVREMDSTVPILELLANQGLQQLSATIAQRSRLVNLEASALHRSAGSFSPNTVEKSE
ncbi:KR domain-containing protein [Xylariomycetidae sp. FL2044]|nr:KR domain-containing protein [Xylariomycetidae sp. FL2044]